MSSIVLKTALGRACKVFSVERQAHTTVSNILKTFKAAGKTGLVWDMKTLSAFLAEPKTYLGSVIGKPKANTRMAFGGIKNEEDIRDLIAYMKEASAK